MSRDLPPTMKLSASLSVDSSSLSLSSTVLSSLSVDLLDGDKHVSLSRWLSWRKSNRKDAEEGWIKAEDDIYCSSTGGALTLTAITDLYDQASLLRGEQLLVQSLHTSAVDGDVRVGTDGVSSFREITVLFVPDLSECIPSFDAWKTRWVAHKKALAERDRLLSQEIKKDVIVGKGSNDAGEVAKDAEKKTSGDPSSAQASGTKKTVKKIIKRVVKTPVNDEKGVARPGENEEKGSEIIVGAQTGGSSDPGAKANEQTPSKTRIKVAKKKVAEVDKSMDSVTRRGFMLHLVIAIIVFCSFDSFKVLLRSLSVSLDSLLDYTDKDIDEFSFVLYLACFHFLLSKLSVPLLLSNLNFSVIINLMFLQLSLFAESLFEMLQYQMGTRILEFLKVGLHVNCFQRKRHQEELSAKQKEAETQNKRQKTVEHNDKETPAITESVPEKGDKESSATETVANTEDPVGKEKTTGDEAAATMEPQKKDEHSEKTSDTVSDAVTEVATDTEEEKGSIVEKTDSKSAETKPKSESDKNEKQEEGTSGATKREETVDNELLQAFRVFDRNQTGYVRVEDMRITIHSLGKFISHREVKELVQSALLESNTGRDDRILYNKLVRELETI
ncbi:hypothetical protein Bca52824_054654 [Brassica carinata]|uniref:EF-hand domain-containing protein n=1 Tax=Brassica carinata TaxID=52824 RepID=A0A8X7RDV2_BRACI|nr:hypothetical protein Bca52824_054654 [Brassica carinata]